MEQIQQKIQDLIEAYLAEKPLYLFDLTISGSPIKYKVKVIIEGDEGVSIDDCASLSRFLGHEMEEQELMEHRYDLEVSSPGVSEPLKLLRQYPKNIGREVRVHLVDQRELEGKLEEVEETQISIRERMKTKNPKIKQFKQKLTVIPFSEITKTNVLVSF